VSPVFSAKAAAPAPEIQPAASNPAPARKPPTEAPPRPSPSQALPVLAAPTPRPVDTEALFRIQHDEVAPPLEPEPSPSTRAGDLVPLDAVDSNPLPLSQPAPEYDPLSRRMRQEGTVTLELLIDERGRVVDVRHQGGSANQRLVEAAERGVRGWRYRPATKDGVPVKVWKPVDIEFRL
jgi:protein TonB